MEAIKSSRDTVAGYKFTFTGSLKDVHYGFAQNKQACAQFSSEEAFIAYIREGAELMLTSPGGDSRGSRYVCLLVSSLSSFSSS